MNTKILMLHGNGGASARFQLFREEVRRHQPDYDVVFPELPGFEGRPLGVLPADPWQLFLTPLQEQIAHSAPETEWILYGHGIGGSLLLEWAARNWSVPARPGWKPKGVLLHGCIGASLKERWFSQADEAPIPEAFHPAISIMASLAPPVGAQIIPHSLGYTRNVAPPILPRLRTL